MKRKKETLLERLWDYFWWDGVYKLGAGVVIFSIVVLVGRAAFFLMEHPVIVFILVMCWLIGHLFVEIVMRD